MLAIEEQPDQTRTRTNFGDVRIRESGPESDLWRSRFDGAFKVIKGQINFSASTAHLSAEAKGDRSQVPVVDMKGITRLSVDWSGKRTAEDQLSGLKGHFMRRELVGEPGDAIGRMIEHGGGDAGLLERAVAIKQRGNPSQVHIQRPRRISTKHDSSARRVVGHGVGDPAW